MRAALLLGAAGVLLALAGCSGDDGSDNCDAAALSSALAAASSGETVRVGACTVTGSFTVPPGVRLAGEAETVLRAEDGVAVRLEPSPDAAAPTTLENVTVVTGGRVGVLARGAGSVALRDVDVEANRGFGVAAESVSSIVMEDVTLAGPITADNADDDAFLTPDPDTMATFGVVLLAVSSAELARVDVTGFAEFGVAVLDQTSDGMPAATPTMLTWTAGSVTDTLGTGIYLSGTTASLEDLEVMNTHDGLRGAPTYGAVFTGDSTVTSLRLRVCDNAGFGLLHEGGGGHHTDLELTNNGTGGLAAGSTMSLELDGGDSFLSGNAAFNILVRDSRNVILRDLEIAGAIELPSSLGPMLGDGIQLVGTWENVLFENLVVRDNQRVAIAVDLGPDGGMGITFTNVMVHSYMAEPGAIGGTVDTTTWQLTPSPPDGTWDAGITRDATSTTADAAFSEMLPVAGIITPSMIARPEGIAGIITPSM